jgi:transcriptional regulator with XRE-family HTH domain
MSFSKKIKELRTEKNWKQETLAKELQLDVRQISLYENNKNSPSIETAVKIAQLFNVSIDYLLIDDYPRKPLYFNDNIFINKLKDIEILTKVEKDSLSNLIDSLIYKNKLQTALDSVKQI